MRLVDFLDEVSARYELSDDVSAFAQQSDSNLEQSASIAYVRSVMVEIDGEIYMCVLPDRFKVDQDALKSYLDAESVSLADEGIIGELFCDCALGAEPPFGHLYGIMTLMDRSLEEHDYIVFQAGTHHDCMRMSVAEYKKLAEPRILDIVCRASDKDSRMGIDI